MIIVFSADRLPLAQTGTLNIFTSKEQEYEQRALLLKRLAFVIFCSEVDQYHKYMPEIQGAKRYNRKNRRNVIIICHFFSCRTTCQQPATAAGRAADPVGGVPVLPGAAAAHVGRSRDQPVADHHRRDGAGVFVHRAGTDDRHRGV